MALMFLILTALPEITDCYWFDKKCLVEFFILVLPSHLKQLYMHTHAQQHTHILMHPNTHTRTHAPKHTRTQTHTHTHTCSTIPGPVITDVQT